MFIPIRIIIICFLLSYTLAGKGGKNFLRPGKKRNKVKPITKKCIPLNFERRRSSADDRELANFNAQWSDRTGFGATRLTSDQALFLMELRAGSVKRNSRIARGAPRRNKVGIPICPSIPGPLRVRKEYRQLTFAERTSFHNALNALKNHIPDPIDGTSAYDIYVKWHRFSNSPAAHRGAAFLPWHREFLLSIENALYEFGYTGPGLPYWDSTLDQTLPSPEDSMLWTASYMGNNQGAVTTGPAANWQMIPECDNILKRAAKPGGIGKNFLFDNSQLNYVFSKSCFKDITYPANSKFEGDHGSVHLFVGGQMTDLPCAPSDPIFFLHHAFVDCIWEEFRQNHQKSNLETEYPLSNFGGDGHSWDDPMLPFPGMINIHGLSNHYTKYYYRCNSRPISCTKQSDCSSSALWCDTTSCRCRARVRKGGDCEGLPDVACGGCNLAEVPRCQADVCVCDAFDKARFILIDGELLKRS